jgi:murein DD-endopeptidase MepM/ murein hydrolase activator NlpD
MFLLAVTPRTLQAAEATTSSVAGGAAQQAQVSEPPTSVAPVPLRIKLPFQAGSTFQVIQGNHGSFTHSGFNTYAWDFGLPEDTPVCAAAAGRVVRVKQDGKSGGASNEYFSQGNTVILDHGNGYFTQYLHLAQGSARVAEGDLVAGGQVIALSGNTGFSSMPHLHFQVQDATGRSLPAVFQDTGKAVPAEESMVTSANDGTGMSQYAGESWLPPAAFSRNAITLISRSLPGHLFRRGHTYPVRGRLVGRRARQVAIYFMSPSGGPPLQTVYATVDRSGFFEAAIAPRKLPCNIWSNSKGQSNMFSLAIAPVNDDGTFWSDISIPVCIR